MSKKQKIQYFTSLQSAFSILTLIVVATTVVGSLVQLIAAAIHGGQTGSNQFYAGFGPLVTIGGGFGVGLLMAAGRRVPRSERIMRAGALAFICSILYTSFFGYLLMLTFPLFGVSSVFTALGPVFALIIAIIFGLIVRSRGDRGRSVLLAGFLLVTLTLLIISFIQNLYYDVATALFTLIPIAIGGLFYGLLKPIGRLTRAFYAVYALALIIFGTFSIGYFAWDSSFAVTSALGIAAIVGVLALFASILFILIALRRTAKR